MPPPGGTTGDKVDPACEEGAANLAAEVEAFRSLVQRGDDASLAAALEKLITWPSDDPCFKACLAVFADCRSPVVATWLTDLLGRTQSADTRERVLAILAALKGQAVVGSLAAGLRAPADATHAEDCAMALAGSASPSCIPALKELLESSDAEDNVRLQAANGLANVGNAEACSILLRASSSARNAELCREAIAGVQSSYGQETLIAAAVDRSLPAETRSAAVAALAHQNSPRVRTVLRNLSSDASTPSLQMEISNALAALEYDENTVVAAIENGESWSTSEN